MLTDLTNALVRARATLFSDLAGGAALAVLLLAALHLPGLS
jgi:hypothetical protein